MNNRKKHQVGLVKPKSESLSLSTNNNGNRSCGSVQYPNNDGHAEVGHDVKPETFLNRIISLDKRISQQLFICCDTDVGFISGTWKRKLLLLCEYSGHEILWLVVISFCLLLYRDDSILWPVYQNLAISFVLDIVVTVCLKLLFRRKRPATNKADMHVLASVDDYSFPSGHATRTTLMACVLLHHPLISSYGRMSLVSWAIIVSLSRTLVGRHYLGDVICGNLIGLVLHYACKAFLWIS